MKKGFYQEMTSRNIGILTREEQKKLQESTVAIAGVGGVGGITVERLVRLGIGGLKIADPEDFDVSNLNRQLGSTSLTVGKNKAKVVGKMLQEINPGLRLELYPQGVTKNNLKDFFRSVDLVIEAIEYNALAEKVIVHQTAREHGLYVITAPTLGFGSTLFVFDPRGMTFEEYFEIQYKKTDLADYRLSIDKVCPQMKAYYKDAFWGFARGERFAPSVGVGCALAAALQSTETVVILLGKRKPIVIPDYVSLDLLTQEMKIVTGGTDE